MHKLFIYIYIIKTTIYIEKKLSRDTILKPEKYN